MTNLTQSICGEMSTALEMLDAVNYVEEHQLLTLDACLSFIAMCIYSEKDSLDELGYAWSVAAPSYSKGDLLDLIERFHETDLSAGLWKRAENDRFVLTDSRVTSFAKFAVETID